MDFTVNYMKELAKFAPQMFKPLGGVGVNAKFKLRYDDT
jgi:hypothetical protein